MDLEKPIMRKKSATPKRTDYSSNQRVASDKTHCEPFDLLISD